MDWSRCIIHADLDAFFAAVEERDDARLRGKPVIVGARPGTRGVVSTANYIARAAGIKSAMPISEAYRLAPGAVYLPVDYERYVKASTEVFAVLEQFADLIEPVSIDEAYLEVTEHAGDEDPEAYARKIKRAVRAQARLVISCGIAKNKLVAKVASDLGKPDGLVMVTPGSEAAFLATLPVRALPGIGPKTAALLQSIEIEEVADLQQARLEDLEGLFSKNSAVHLKAIAQGEDDTPLQVSRQPQQVSSQRVFQRDLTGEHEIERELRSRAREVAQQLAASGQRGRTVGIMVRFAHKRDERMVSVTRSRTLFEPTHDSNVIAEVAGALLGRLRSEDRRAIRLLGVNVSGLAHLTAEQTDLFHMSAVE